MEVNSGRWVIELSDARCDVVAYACWVAIRCQGPGYNEILEQRLWKTTVKNDGAAPIFSSAGALIEGLDAIGKKGFYHDTVYDTSYENRN